MARHKPAVLGIRGLDAANMVLKEIGLLEGHIEKIDAEAHEAIAEIKATAAKAGERARKKIAELASMLGAYAQSEKGELFKDKKSIQLSFGVFGFRRSTSIRIKKDTVELLKKLEHHECVRVKEEADKEAMANLDDDTLAQVDAVRKTKDDFFCEADRERINEELLREETA